MSFERPDSVAGIACIGCANGELLPVLSLGETPLADVLLTREQIDKAEEKYLLEIAYCPECHLLQLTSNAPPDRIYGDDYPYFTSALPGLLAHFRKSALDILATRRLDSASLVIEAGSNDGYMLEVFAEHGIPVLGVDPAPQPARIAVAKGVPTICDFFSADLAKELRNQGKKARVLIANNLLNLMPVPNEFAIAVQHLLEEEGVAVVEVPYAVEMIEQGSYDTIFHQNRSYWSFTALARLFERHDLFISDVERIPTFGGSLRLLVEKRNRGGQSVRTLLEEERGKGVDLPSYYTHFAERAEKSRRELVQFLKKLKGQGETIAAYGAAGGMATTLISFTEIDGSIIDFAVDVNEFKHGKYTPGSHIMIHPTEKLLEVMPGYVLLLAWNYAAEILEQQSEYRRRGGRFVIPIPELTVV